MAPSIERVSDEGRVRGVSIPNTWAAASRRVFFCTCWFAASIDFVSDEGGESCCHRSRAGLRSTQLSLAGGLHTSNGSQCVFCAWLSASGGTDGGGLLGSFGSSPMNSAAMLLCLGFRPSSLAPAWGWSHNSYEVHTRRGEVVGSCLSNMPLYSRDGRVGRYAPSRDWLLNGYIVRRNKVVAGRQDWFRRATWTSGDRAAFELRLGLIAHCVSQGTVSPDQALHLVQDPQPPLHEAELSTACCASSRIVRSLEKPTETRGMPRRNAAHKRGGQCLSRCFGRGTP